MNYLYNGVELPALPEWDRETYPHVVITDAKPHGYTDRYTMWVCSNPWVQLYNGVQGYYSLFADVGTVYKSWLSIAGGIWEDYLEGTVRSAGLTISGLTWANCDLLDESGNIVLSATTPISLANQTVIEWDGDTTDLESTTRSFTYSDGTVITNTYYKVSDVVPSKKQVLGGYNVIDFHGTLVTGENDDTMEKVDGDICADAGFLVTESGIWLHKYEGELGTDYTSVFTYATVVADTDPVSWWIGYQLGQAIRSLLK